MTRSRFCDVRRALVERRRKLLELTAAPKLRHLPEVEGVAVGSEDADLKARHHPPATPPGVKSFGDVDRRATSGTWYVDWWQRGVPTLPPENNSHKDSFWRREVFPSLMLFSLI